MPRGASPDGGSAFSIVASNRASADIAGVRSSASPRRSGVLPQAAIEVTAGMSTAAIAVNFHNASYAQGPARCTVLSNIQVYLVSSRIRLNGCPTSRAAAQLDLCIQICGNVDQVAHFVRDSSGHHTVPRVVDFRSTECLRSPQRARATKRKYVLLRDCQRDPRITARAHITQCVFRTSDSARGIEVRWRIFR